MAKLSRYQVRAIVDEEARFSEKWDRERPEGSLADADKPVEFWLYWINIYQQKAGEALARNDEKAALHNLRCILNLAEACAMHHGLPRRDESDSRDIY